MIWSKVQHVEPPYRLFVWCSLALSTFAFLAFIWTWRRFGFDLTDEAFYYLWMQNPFAFRFSLTQFGFVLHPVYLLFDGSVFSLRLWSDLTSFALAWLLVFLLLKKITGEGSRALEPALLSFSVAPAALLVTVFELPPSPSYNTCAFQALILYGIGIVLASDDRGAGSTARGVAGSFVCGAAFVLVALVKPPSVVPLALLTVPCLIFLVRDRRQFVLIGALAFLGLFALFLLLTGRTPIEFIDRVRAGLVMANLFSQHDAVTNLFRWDSFYLSSQLKLYFCAAAVGTAVLMVVFDKFGLSSVTAIFACAAAASVGAILLLADGGSFEERYAGVTLLFFPAGIVLFDLVRRQPIGRKQLILALVFLALPFAYAFGTNRPYWLNAEGAGLFWACTGLALLPRRQDRNAAVSLPAIFVMQITIAFLLVNAIERPHRQTQSLRLATEPVDIDGKGHHVLVSPDLARYIETLRVIARKAGFTAGTPVIDLTGRTPGAVLVLQAKAPGVPWLIGGNKGSVQFAQAALGYASCAELAHSWVLIEPQGRDESPPSILAKLGLDAERDYEIAGSLPSSATLYGRSFEQVLLKPRPGTQAREQACEARRKT